jgi:protein-L-isoaspartate(D-aspartate) O-methyltransferase
MGIFSRIAPDTYADQRREMVKSHIRSRGIADEPLLRALERVPREQFLAERYRTKAYEDHPLPIGEGQTISQPYIVAIMLAALALRPSDRVLEVGTGSGYQTALLAELTQHVYSIERQETLSQEAAAVLAGLHYTNITLVTGDGTQGLPQHAPYDAIIVSAAAPRIPQPLFEQLAEGGRVVLPVGPQQGQELQLVHKRDGQPVITSLGGCAFVPLIGTQVYIAGW